MFEIIVFVTAMKYILVEGGEQALVGIGVISRIGIKETLKITLLGLAIGIVLYFVFLNFASVINTRILEIALGAGLLFFSFTMFREFFEKETKENAAKYRIGYLYIAILEAVENSIALATFSLIQITSAISGAVVAIGVILGLLWLGLIRKIPLRLTRLIAGVLLASTGIPLVLYGLGVQVPGFFRWLVPPIS